MSVPLFNLAPNLTVSRLCLGTMTFGEQNSLPQSLRLLDQAFDAGINFFDSAEMYPVPQRAETQGKSEEYFGQWVRKRKISRDRVVIATKVYILFECECNSNRQNNFDKDSSDLVLKFIAGVVWTYDGSLGEQDFRIVAGPSGQMSWIRDGPKCLDAKNITEAVDGSLKRLQMDHIDLYQIHWPDRFFLYNTGAVILKCFTVVSPAMFPCLEKPSTCILVPKAMLASTTGGREGMAYPQPTQLLHNDVALVATKILILLWILMSRVSKISRGCDNVVVNAENGLSFIADAAIVTVPLGVLKANLIQFEPKLPEWKVAAISDIGVGNENKIALLFDRVFWPNVELLGIVARTSYSCGYFLNLHKATGHPILVYMAAGRFADDLEKFSDEYAVNFVMSQLKKMFPDATEPVQYLVSHWGTDPNSLGCYSYDPVGMAGDVYDKLREPLDNLFFGGEAVTEEHQGSVHGAYSSGVLAARNCESHLLERLGDFRKLQLISFSGDALLEPIFPLQISRM
ncbi:hypothetical protein GOBAR_AA08759 [Gossypium barbadense]|uniref:Amine oxidase domain-containing protein n=1 Tax=Gossypium barbadense TaxID=3634 RepID=A0A2P5Y8H8_GOSBA|nr:hypothetical protein GOBAR_AA08759 [Gossypium barbadense]